MEEPDPYAVLGVARSATVGAIISAFRRAARDLRPDIQVDAVTAARFGEVRAAYETLRDPVRRAAYDRAHGGSREQGPSYAEPYRPARAAGASRPLRRYVGRCPGPVLAVPGVTAAEPPLRAGPVRWEPPGGPSVRHTG
ncbi:J domain-containing protein [Streptomyces sp. PBH53]|uniref:J domain-containing protein n=1 Tax=Streptomyces sp. PBH53 TaxID=1577075 RepID=UPI000B154662|nr:J domain-containing protein [Streptomyces sp. PBH53]